ncbi:MAG: Acg family FMN-binding oxidoreductase [Mycobacteriales bacterium]
MAAVQVDLREQAEELARVGGLAPSLHNAQPWAFRVGPDRVEVLLDRGRLLPVADPAGRQAHLGLGAAVFLLRLKLSSLDYAVATETSPQPAQADLVARLTVRGRRPATDTERRLLAAVSARRTVRTPFTGQDVPVPLRVAWRECAEAEGAGLRWVEGPGERAGVAALVAAAERLQQRNPAYLAELDRWTAATTISAGAGVPPSAFGVSTAAGHAAEFPLRDFAGGRATDRPRHAGPVEAHPVLAVLHTPGDHPADWLAAGQALMHILLAAAADHYAASYLNQPLELPALRQQLRDELRLTGWPQLILRLGHPQGTVPPQAGRRPPADLLRPPP